jgi:hypothetical protein
MTISIKFAFSMYSNSRDPISLSLQLVFPFLINLPPFEFGNIEAFSLNLGKSN